MTVTAQPATRVRQQRLARAIVVMISVSAFGPYLVSGIRTEQVMVYATGCALMLGGYWTRLRPSGTGLLVLTLLGVELLVAVVVAADAPTDLTPYQLGPLIPGLDNLVLPICVLLIVWMLLGAGGDRVRLLAAVCRTTVAAMVVNAGLSIWQTAGGAPDLRRFQGQPGVESVAYRAEQWGRYTGVFNQPAEAGLMYSVALIAAIYVYRRRPAVLALVATPLAIGGILSVSKVFLLVGLPVGIWQVLRTSGGRRRRLTAIGVTALVAVALVWSGVAPRWIGGDYLLRLVPHGNQNALDLYTAGRIGSGTSLATVTHSVLKSSPIWGYGAGGLQVAYDNGWVEALVVAGVIGMAVFTAVLVTLVLAWWPTRHDGESDGHDLSRMVGCLLAVLVGAAVGLPSLTANRCATIVWLLLALTLLSADRPGARPVYTLKRNSTTSPSCMT